MVILSLEMYEAKQVQLELYAKLAEAEVEIANGAEGIEFLEFARKLKNNLYGKI